MPLRTDYSLRRVTQGVAACIADYGVAFIEDDKLDALEATLLAFFRAAEIPVRDPKPADPDVAVAG